MPSRLNHKACVAMPWVGWLFIALLWCAPCQAQTVIFHLKNGDRITGRLLSETTNGVVIATGFSENLPIAANMIQRREVVPATPPTAAPETPAPNPAAAPTAPPPATPPTNRPPATVSTNRLPSTPASGVVGELVLTNRPTMVQSAGGAEKTPAAPAAKPPEKPAEKPADKPAEKVAEKPAAPPEPSAFRKFLSEWNGEAQLGANFGFSTKDRSAFTSRIKVTHNLDLEQNRHLRNILDYDVSYGRTDGVLSDNQMEGSWKVEYDLNKRFLLYNVSRSGYDEVRGIDLQYDFGPGLGYKWVVRTNFVFKNELGGNYQEQFFARGEKTSRYSLRLAEDMWWQITPKMRWDEKIEFFPDLQDSDYRVRLETNLSYLLKQNLTLTLNVVDLYDTAVPEGVSRNDLQIRSLLGIKF